jgi:hypothetical protein
MLCEFDPSLIEELIGRAKVSGRLLMSLGYLVYQLKYKPIEMALLKTMGQGWTQQLAEEERKRLTWGRPSP